jgi:hypothetical protein
VVIREDVVRRDASTRRMRRVRRRLGERHGSCAANRGGLKGKRCLSHVVEFRIPLKRSCVKKVVEQGGCDW